ncbi:MAG: DUF3307 domain-containing protein [Flavobacteriaceae bacterium CG_4_8_14_3_um_filter_34_10]|nr:DUF3307 domain-containing protein [Flavobacteriia bacterium]OIP52326.1 MAG: hypothetical protein AUK33_01540 [Flavobacteriaceae bacterium CG2_30_34_30]PIQ17779.1 MAG: hypothetical protein COW66_10115 [Flavobacteriaceae bacterium CG18_big_fil_WC_8_21_14_2_50_34_36]PIV50162.1 MAG: DUF3307 domain-containing protein [Flavobacteriaceae bacterium CG02_land_8_20_14_3_00_34_13]PIX08561.1 MAG: DUF3307 domain-containing protein [Flavobacteriaceae bacterium CG_4_8_14_3_um_filter_34_10]PIZ08840.1 MAG: 
MNESILIALQLLLAHLLTDFALQPVKYIQQKREKKARAPFLYIHAGIAGFLTYLFLQQWSQIFIPILIIITHFFIDLWKLNKKEDNLKYFLLDQLFHLLVLLLAWLYLTANFQQIMPFIDNFLHSKNTMVLFIGYLLAISPIGFIIGKATKHWQVEIAKDGELDSLQKAGRYIGIFERILVLTFVLTYNIAAIGFLIAAKSILRFNDKGKSSGRKQTEYVLIGTLMSFSVTIIIGFLMLQILGVS